MSIACQDDLTAMFEEEPDAVYYDAHVSHEPHESCLFWGM